MRVKTCSNDTFIIQANMNKKGDYENMFAVATEMAKWSNFDIASGCDTEGWIHLSGCWDNFQAEQIMEEYQAAKAVVLNRSIN